MIEVWTQFKATEKIPAAGKYKCVICGMIIDVAPHFIEHETTFFACPVCHAWSEWWPKSELEDVWEYLG